MSSSALPLSANPSDDAARELKSALEDQASAWLVAYTQRLAQRHTSLDEKVINDAVWGSVRLYPWEVAVADSPLMQRLRGIRQLGVVHWVYPNATHSRFEHSIGVAHAVDQILDGVERNSGVVGRPVVDAYTRYLMRLAGLVHDCGHVVMSHVTESVIEGLPGVEDLRGWLLDGYGLRKKPSVSEAFAAVLVRSPAFRNLLGAPIAGADFMKDPDDACATIAGLLLGGPVFPDKPYLTLVINGPFDADKLDYMQRDAMMAGVPSALDVSRLLEKIHVVELPSGERAEFNDYRQWAGTAAGEPLAVLALPRSATSVLDELATGRTTLYEKVYFHQKVRAIELQVRGMMESQTQALGLAVQDWLELSDDTVIHWDEPNARALRERSLSKRAFHFSAPDGNEDADDANSKEWQIWRAIRRTMKSEKMRRALNEKLYRYSVDAGRHLAHDVTPLDLHRPAIDLPPVKDLDQFAFVGDTFRDLESANAAIAGQRSETGKRLAKYRGYVYAPEACLIDVFFGALKALADEFGMELSPSAFSNTKLEPAELRTALDKLIAADFFDADAAKPVMASLKRGERSFRTNLLERFLRVAWPRILRVSESLGRYQTQDGEPVTGAKVAEFVRQFETIERARVALRLLESLEFRGRPFFVQALTKCLERAKEDGREISFVCPLGSTGDSSAMLSYLMGDVPPALRIEVLQLEIALEQDAPGTIVLWDDFCGRAGHAITTLAQWLDATELVREYVLEERLARPLGEDRAERLRATPVLIMFAITTPDGIARLKEAVARLGLEHAVVMPGHAEQPNEDLLTRDETVFRSDDERADFYAFVSKRARQIHESKRNWAESKTESRLLGYGNWAARLVFFYNVPTVTLTVLWDTGAGWTPLLPRRSKPNEPS